MLKKIGFSNWKSFKESTLYIDPLTVLIGTNASGKSNALDGIAFLNRTAQGKNLQASLTGDNDSMIDSYITPIRGGIEWAALKPGNEFTLQALIGDDELDYEYSITVRTLPQVELISESLFKIKYGSNTNRLYKSNLFKAYVQQENSPSIIGELNNGKGRPKKEEFKRSTSVLSQLKNQKLRKEIETAIETIIKALEGIFILDPVPSLMRAYRPYSSTLSTNASNLAGMLAALPDNEKVKIEDRLSFYISKLPEGDIRKVWAEPVGKFKNDAMLYCEEQWGENQEPLIMDARGMSDGTLRFLGILTALLTRPSGTLVVVEEVDNGLHPSRAKLLLQILREIGEERNIDILVTTHNPALMDELGPEMTPFIMVAHRSRTSGKSKLTLLEDITNLPKLLAYGSLGKISTQGYLEKSLSEKGGEDINA